MKEIFDQFFDYLKAINTNILVLNKKLDILLGIEGTIQEREDAD